jgi:hypothetical protein
MHLYRVQIMHLCRVQINGTTTTGPKSRDSSQISPIITASLDQIIKDVGKNNANDSQGNNGNVNAINGNNGTTQQPARAAAAAAANTANNMVKDSPTSFSPQRDASEPSERASTSSSNRADGRTDMAADERQSHRQQLFVNNRRTSSTIYLDCLCM